MGLDVCVESGQKRVLRTRIRPADRAPTFCQTAFKHEDEMGPKIFFDLWIRSRVPCTSTLLSIDTFPAKFKIRFPPNSNNPLRLRIAICNLKKGKKNIASPGNRTRVARMGILHDTTTQ